MTGKKGQLGNQMLLAGFIFFIVIVGGGISIGAYIFAGSEFSFFQAEAVLLNQQMQKCVYSYNVSSQNIYDACNLNKAAVEKNNGIKICLNSADCINEGESSKIAASTRGTDYFVACGLPDAGEFIGCYRSFISKGGNKIEILTTSNQKIRRIL
jgi:hypothetical protein